jgi:hypothetical protein
MDITRYMEFLTLLVFTVIIVPVGKAAWHWLRSKAKSEPLQKAMDEAEAVAGAAVAALQNNLVDGWKAAATDGKLTAGQIGNVAGQAFTAFMNQISAGALQILQDNKPDLTGYVENLIVKKLEDLKITRAQTCTTAPAPRIITAKPAEPPSD